MTATLATAGRTPKTSATIDPTMADVVAPDVALLPAVLGTPKAVQAMETTAAHARVGDEQVHLFFGGGVWFRGTMRDVSARGV